jgi:hypothetical protein
MKIKFLRYLRIVCVNGFLALIILGGLLIWSFFDFTFYKRVLFRSEIPESTISLEIVQYDRLIYSRNELIFLYNDGSEYSNYLALPSSSTVDYKETKINWSDQGVELILKQRFTNIENTPDFTIFIPKKFYTRAHR